MKRPWAKLSGACFIGMFIVAIVASASGGFIEENKGYFIASIVLGYAGIGFFIAHLVCTREERKKLRTEYRVKKNSAEAVLKRTYTPRVMSAVYVGETERDALRRTFRTALLGPVGVLVGIYRTINPKKVTFYVTYDTGRSTYETVKVGSERYIHLMCLSEEG